MLTIIAYAGAAGAGIAGCFAFWAWLRLGKSVWRLLPGGVSLALFAYLLTLVDSAAAGRTYADYGGVYIAASLSWLWAVEGGRPDRWDLSGASLCLLGLLSSSWDRGLPEFIIMLPGLSSTVCPGAIPSPL